MNQFHKPPEEGCTAPRPDLESEPPFRTLCTDCGISRSSNPAACGSACQFIAPDYPSMEQSVHGRERDADRPDELHFGPFLEMHQAAMKKPAEGAQWTGITTGIAERLLAAGKVDAVLTVVPDDDDRWKPVPAVITKTGDMRKARGMRMGYAPLLALLEPAIAAGHNRLAVIGIPCQVYALRRIEKTLGLEKLYVIGTPCSDNTTTENFHHFLSLLADQPETVTYCEFRADFHVELRFEDGTNREIPFLQLPISKLPSDFFPLTCRTCVDYTNVLADITIGYMGGNGEQWLIVRNETGRELLRLLGDDIRLQAPISKGNRKGPVKGFVENTKRAAGGLPLRRMPIWLRPLMAWLMPRTGPKGLEFARTRVEMKAAETIIHLEREMPRRMKTIVPEHVRSIAADILSEDLKK